MQMYAPSQTSMFFSLLFTNSQHLRDESSTLWNTFPDSSMFYRRKKKNSPKPGLVALCEETIALTPDASFLYFRHPPPPPPRLSVLLYSYFSIYPMLPVSRLPPLPPSPPLTPSMSQSFGLLCLPLLLSWTHVGLIELEDPALIKGRVWLNTSKPPRLQSRTG